MILESDDALTDVFDGNSDEDTIPIAKNQLGNLTRDPVEGEFVLVEFNGKKDKICYLAIQEGDYDVEGAPMGSSLSPVIANLFMMHFEKEALNNARLKPTMWKRYVDDIFIIWPHGKQELDRFVTYLNNIHPRIQFTTEREENRQLPFLDLLITRKPTGNLAWVSGHEGYKGSEKADGLASKGTENLKDNLLKCLKNQ
ncbi:uncharacterized protein [Leptinotarsa decemlineata]|uniref:uncharacterized protein n=1 Tax=Leptinotarsa decemlineata TaxID=7539 RepID=UPI003D3086A1